MALDRTDRAIIAELTRDSRLSVRAIAEAVHISRSAAHTRIRTLVDTGVLTGFSAQVNRHAIGLNVTAIVIVQVGEVEWPTLAASLVALPFVESVLAVSGDIDFVITVSAPDQEQLSNVIMHKIRSLPGVLSTRSHVVLDSRIGTTPGSNPDVWLALPQ